MNPYLLPALLMTPDLIRRAFSRLPRDLWDARKDPERFTPREVVCHLCDWEPILLERLKAGVETPGVQVPYFDEGQRAVDLRYSEWDPFEALERWKQAREQTVAFIKTLSKEDFHKTFVHPKRGETTIYDAITMMPCHDIYHLEQITSYLPEEKVADVW